MLCAMKAIRIFQLLFLVAAAGFGLYACTASEPEAPAVPTLNRGLLSDPESLDIHKARSTQAAEVQRDIGEGLLSYSATGELTGGVAESWSVSDDGRTYTFTLREDARWSNGDPVTAEHFVFAMRRLVDPATAAFYAQAVAAIENAPGIVAGNVAAEELGVAAVDARTLVINLAQPTPYFLNLLTHPSTFPLHPGLVAEHGENFARPEFHLSNGAYQLVAWEPASQIRLVRNEHYWNNAETSIDAVHYHIVTQELTQLNRFRAGELDTTDTIPPENFAAIREQFGDQMRIAPYLGVFYYGFNLTKPPFADNPELRQALSMAIRWSKK